MGEAESLFSVLRRTAEPAAVAAIEELVAHGSDHELNRINALAFAGKRGLHEDDAIAAFLHASRLGIFEMSWNVLCPGCGGVLGANASLKGVHEDVYTCRLCAAGYEPTLDEMVEVAFTVSPRVRRIAAHDPNTLPPFEYFRQVFWSSGVDLPDDGLEEEMADAGGTLHERRQNESTLRAIAVLSYAIGIDRQTAVPRPGVLSMRIQPPKRSTMRLASARPTPSPFAFVV